MSEADHEDAVQNEDGWYVTPPPKPRPPVRRALFATSLVFSGAFLGALVGWAWPLVVLLVMENDQTVRNAATRNEYVWRPMTEEEFDIAAQNRAILGAVIGTLLVGGGVAVNLIRGERL